MDKLTKWKIKNLEILYLARTTPKQKLENEDVYQKAGKLWQMTGRWRKDAPNQEADVGIAWD